MIGETISHYRVLEKLGGGGMGVVYKARDSRLDRMVALKFLPPDLTRDDTAKQRFIQEAKAASGLDHPNICTIYDIGETPEGQLFIVMAFCEGETLKKKIERGPLKLDEALDFAIQVAQGLGKAHAASFVHRDIKPANLLITDGLVKIVDFGLAKLVGRTGITRTGATLGTVAYMSPEQVCAEGVDQRSDIWSLGVVLYEMVTGQLPFRGDHQATVSNAIVQSRPTPLTALRTGVPMELERLVDRALSKRADERYQTVADLLAELRRVRRESDPQAARLSDPRAGTGIAWRHGRKATFAFVLVILLAGLGYVMLRPARSKAGIPRLTNPLQATTALGVEDFPTWAPDGSTLAYAANVSGERGGNWDIWVAQVGGGAPVNRTADFPGNDMFPSWSPDGRQIAFWSEREGGAVFVMPAVGGTPRRVIASGQLFATQPAWSPDGTMLAHPARDAKGELAELVTLRTGESRRMPLAGRAGNQRLDLKWSPDGRLLAYVDARTYQAQVTQIWVLRLADEKAIAVSDARMNDWSPTWSPDGGVLYFVSNRGGSRDLWEQRVGEDGTPTGDPERVTTGIEVRHAAFSPDGNKLAYSKGRQVANLWRVPIVSQRPATWAEAQQLTFDQAFIEFADVSRDGARLLVSSDRSGNPDLWILPAGGGEMQQLTNDPTPDWDGRWSPDGREVAFYAYRSGNREVWIMPSSGGSARQVTHGETESVFPAWSPDGREIAFDSPRGGNRDVWVVPVTGGQPRRVTDDPAVDQFPSWSPDGKWLAFASNRSGEPCLWRVPAAGGRAEPLSKGPGSIPKWSPGGKKVYFLATREGRPNIWAISVEDGREYPMTDLSGRRGNPGIYVLTTDDRYLYFSWEENFGDLWVMDAVSQRQ